jgi:glyoxylase-like metal-dependent hydrolase (beta-lactamase superfamily II)
MKTISSILVLLVLVGLIALGRSFSAATLEVPPLAIESLPKASPPAGMSLSMLPTGAIKSTAAFAFRGGKFGDERNFVMPVILVRHPRGNLLFDTGFGRNVDEQVKTLPRLMQLSTTYEKGTPAAEQLTANGFKLTDLAGVVLTHSHWDHVSGLDSLPGVPVWMNAAEQKFIADEPENAVVLRGLGELKYQTYEFDGGPYLGFPSSHDVWGDGSIVLVPAPGHTPGSTVAFITLPSGKRYALLGDLVWQLEGINLPAERPWLLRRIINEDDAQVRENIIRVAAIHQRFREINMIPAHDARAAALLPVFPAVER